MRVLSTCMLAAQAGKGDAAQAGKCIQETWGRHAPHPTCMATVRCLTAERSGRGDRSTVGTAGTGSAGGSVCTSTDATSGFGGDADGATALSGMRRASPVTGVTRREAWARTGSSAVPSCLIRKTNVLLLPCLAPWQASAPLCPQPLQPLQPLTTRLKCPCFLLRRPDPLLMAVLTCSQVRSVGTLPCPRSGKAGNIPWGASLGSCASRGLTRPKVAGGTPYAHDVWQWDAGRG